MRSQKAVYSQDVGLTAILDAFEADTTKKHDSKVADAFGTTASEDQATSLVFMRVFVKSARRCWRSPTGLNLSAFFCLAANEYITNHKG